MAVNESLRVLRTVHYDATHYSLFLQAGTIGPQTQAGAVRDAPGRRRPPALPAARLLHRRRDEGRRACPAIEFVVKAVGVGTTMLGPLRGGDADPGPRAARRAVSRWTTSRPSDRVALVAGGIGLAPLVLLARELAARGIAADLFYGGRNEKDVLKRADFERFLGPHRCRYATDDGSLGRKGLVTDLVGAGARRRVRATAASSPAGRCRCSGRSRSSSRRRRSTPRSPSSRRWRAASASASAAWRRRRTAGSRPSARKGPACRRRPSTGSGSDDVVDLSVRLGRLALKNPIATASGTFGYGLEFAEFVDLGKLGAISVKGLSVRPCHGNPPPRICETDAGMLNAIGLQNVGVEAFLAEKLPELHRLGATVIANVWGDTEEEYVAVVERIGDDRRVAAIELNVSCPNVVKGGLIFGNNPQALGALVKRVRAATPLPLDREALAERHRHHGDGAGRRRQRGRRPLAHQHARRPLDRRRDAEPKIGFTTGGLSGPAIRPVAVRMVWEVRKALPKVPIFGIGGIETRRARRRVPDRRRERRPGRHGELPRPVARRPARRRAGRLVRRGTAWRASRS